MFGTVTVGWNACFFIVMSVSGFSVVDSAMNSAEAVIFENGDVLIIITEEVVII